MGYNSIAWLPLAAGLTVIGLILSYSAWRRRGLRSGLYGVAWSLLPIAAYLTGSIEMFWKIGSAIGDFASGFVFSPERWAGVGVAALAGVLFFTTGGRRRRKAARTARKEARAQQGTGAAEVPGSGTGAASLEPGTATQPVTTERLPQRVQKPAKADRAAAPAADDDMKDIEEILRKRGI
jgi:hypothetical protein